jgi:hypothetical protein
MEARYAPTATMASRAAAGFHPQQQNGSDIPVDGSTIEVSADALRVKDAGITNAKLANSGVTVTGGDGLASGGAVVRGRCCQ